MMTWRQYGLFRGLFGLWLLVHFVYLLPWSAELFSAQGMLPDAELGPLFGIVPGLFHLSDSPVFVNLVVLSAALAALLFIAGRGDRLAAVWMWLVLASLFSRNPLIANPALPYAGFMLWLHILTPRPSASFEAETAWRHPTHLYIAAVVILALTYSYSGYTKLFSPGWIEGETVRLVLDNPLARDGWVRELALTFPEPFWSAITWFILLVELLYAPLYLARRLRPCLWSAMFLVQLGFLFLLRFPDLTIPMLLFHLLTFDHRWLPQRSAAKATLVYDGDCGLCHGVVRFSLSEAPADLRFAPIQLQPGFSADVSSWELRTENGAVLRKSAAAISLLKSCGGVWRLIAHSFTVIPRPVRDGVYDLIARYRRRWLPQPDSLCPLVPAHMRFRFDS